MKHRLFYAPAARRDLDEIWDHIALELGNPSGAEKTVCGILEQIDQLETFPQSGATLSSVTGVESDYRFLVCGKYLAFYRVNGNDVYVDRILYGRRDYLKILFEEQTD